MKQSAFENHVSTNANISWPNTCGVAGKEKHWVPNSIKKEVQLRPTKNCLYRPNLVPSRFSNF